MKIALVAPTELPARRANTIQVMKMAQALVEAGYDIRVASPDAQNIHAQNHPSRTWENLADFYGLRTQFPVEWLPAQPWMKRYDYGWMAVRWARAWGAEVIYTRLPQSAAFASRAGLKTIFEIHDVPSGFMGSWLFRRFLTGNGARRLIVISQALLHDLAARFAIPQRKGFTLVAADGVDLNRYENLPEPLPARQQLPAEVNNKLGLFVAGYTGHLYTGRGIEIILGMAGLLPDTSFLIVGGEAQDVERVQVQVESRGLKNIVLTGFVNNSKLPMYQASCNVLLMPYQSHVSASSGGDIARYLSPMKLFEYMASGRAILSSNLPVLCETLSAENAILLPSDDVEAWVKALHELQTDSVRRQALGDSARRAATNYSWENRARSIMDGL